MCSLYHVRSTFFTIYVRESELLTYSQTTHLSTLPPPYEIRFPERKCFGTTVLCRTLVLSSYSLKNTDLMSYTPFLLIPYFNLSVLRH